MNYLFYLLNEYSIPVVSPLVAYLKKNKNNTNYRFFVSNKLEEKVENLFGKNKLLHTLEEVKQYHPNFVISAENYMDYRIPGLKVQVFHGVGVEKKSHFCIRHFYDIYLTSGPFVTKNYLKLARQYGYFRVIETGWPKFDHILNYTPKDTPIYDKSTHKYILYAPTFSRRMQSATALVEHILNERKENEVWLIKFHELMSPEIIHLFQQAADSKLQLIYENDITPYLHLADVMISDTSSVIYEFLSLNKPVITYRTLGNPQKGIDIKHPGELRKTLDIVLQNPDFGKEERQQMLSQVNPYLDGCTAERIFEALDTIEKKGLNTNKEKPLNLFRKAKILYGNY